MKRIISTTMAPAAVGPYSQAVEKNGCLFISGQIPLKPGSSEIEIESVSEQTKQVLDNLKNILEAANYTIEDVVKTTCYLTDMATFNEMNQVYAQYFSNNTPARATVEVGKLPKGARIEIEAIAMK